MYDMDRSRWATTRWRHAMPPGRKDWNGSPPSAERPTSGYQRLFSLTIATTEIKDAAKLPAAQSDEAVLKVVCDVLTGCFKAVQEYGHPVVLPGTALWTASAMRSWTCPGSPTSGSFRTLRLAALASRRLRELTICQVTAGLPCTHLPRTCLSAPRRLRPGWLNGGSLSPAPPLLDPLRNQGLVGTRQPAQLGDGLPPRLILLAFASG